MKFFSILVILIFSSVCFSSEMVSTKTFEANCIKKTITISKDNCKQTWFMSIQKNSVCRVAINLAPKKKGFKILGKDTITFDKITSKNGLVVVLEKNSIYTYPKKYSFFSNNSSKTLYKLLSTPKKVSFTFCKIKK